MKDTMITEKLRTRDCDRGYKQKKRSRRIGGECVRQALNDPAAALFILDRQQDFAVWERIDTEFTTDVLERRPNELAGRESGIHTSAMFRIDGDRLVCVESGQDMQEMLDSSVAAAEMSTGSLAATYGLAREQARQTEVIQILDWVSAGGCGSLLKSSLCPPTTELDELSAEQLNFRQSRLMSVNTLYTLEDGVLKADYFTLEDHDMRLQQRILKSFGNDSPGGTTIEELRRMHVLEGNDPLHTIYETAGQNSGLILDESKLVTAKNMNMRLIKECQMSEAQGCATEALAKECRSLGIDVPTGDFNRITSRSIFKTFRSVSIPHFMYGVHAAKSGTHISSDSGRDGVYTASREAGEKEIVYAGDCPDGAQTSSAGSLAVNSFGAGGGAVGSIYAFRQHAKMNELRSRLKGYGSCQSCGAYSGLFGCGIFCGKCNRTWCDYYENSRGSIMLTPRQVKEKRGLRYRRKAA